MTTATESKVRRKRAKPDSALETRVAQMEVQQTAILDAVKGLGEAFIQFKTDSSRLPLAVDPEKQLQDFRAGAAREAAQERERTGQDVVASRSRTVDLMNPRAGLTGYQPRDIVRLLPQTGLHQRIMADFSRRQEQAPDGIYGVIRKFMYVAKKNGQRKYRVRFEGIGDEGCLEGELELARAV